MPQNYTQFGYLLPLYESMMSDSKIPGLIMWALAGARIHKKESAKP